MKFFINKFNFTKFVAIFTSISFIFTGVIGHSAFASVGSSMPAINTINFDNPIIPTSLGKITSAKYFDSDDIIINIQDLHCHAETQRKIVSIISYIDNTYTLNNVYLEGAFKTVDTSWLSSFGNNKNGTKVLEGLIDSGKLSGTEYYSIINNKKNFVLGIEQEDLYKENIKLLGSILSLQPEIEAICSQMEKEINKIKRDYSSRQARKLEKLIKSFKQKNIDAKYYYNQLKLLADNFKLSIDKYPNIKIYLSLLDNSHYINNKKVIYEFTKFVSDIKNILPYQQYSQLLKKSNNFNNIEDVSSDLIALDKEYEITKKLKLENFKNFLTYLEFNQNINPIQLVQEEKHFINELYIKAGRTKYEKEVSFLSEFIHIIRQYFTADISADEYYEFENGYNLFKTIWPSYFSENILKNLDKYQTLLSQYHKNNILRDNIFAECLISQKNINGKNFTNDTNSAIKQIKANLKNKKIKLVVTGGFHTRGLERIFEKQKISYVIITPKITQPIEQAKQIYIDNVIYYSNILKNTINLEPLTQEPLNVSFPKIMNLIFSETQNNIIFEEYSKEELIQAVKQFVQEYIIEKQDSFYGDVEILNWDIISTDLTSNIEFYVEYKDNANKATISNMKYRFVDGQVIPYSTIDTVRTTQMLERINTNKYAQPSVELEPTNTTRKKIAKYILDPLSKSAGRSITLMPFEQLHMTIGYDSVPTQQQIDSFVEQSDTTGDIFSVLDILGQDFVNFRTSMAGTLKLMPDGVIIYEITDKKLIEQMLNFRTTLKGVDTKYKTPSIVHMSIGRITDMKLLDGSEQSKQELAELLKKINETIYEINKKNALSKIKTTFTLKSGYVSSTGDKDYSFRRIFPQKESLVIFKNLVNSSKTKLDFIHKVIIAPLIEEFIFRFIPFFISGLLISTPVSIVPFIITGIVGILGFSFAHPLADKINNYFHNKNEIGQIKSNFIGKLFNRQVIVRDIKSFLIPSVILTTLYIAVSLVLPQATFLALAITTVFHSIYNLFSVKQNKGKELTLKQNSEQGKNSNIKAEQIEQSLIDTTIEALSTLTYYDKIKEIVDKLSNLPEDANEKYNIVIAQVYNLIDFLKENHKKNYNIQLSFEDKYGKYYEEDTLYGKLRKYCLENGLIKSYDSNIYLSKVLVHILIPFLTLTDIKNSGNFLFYSIIDSLFVDGEKDRDENTVASEMGMLIGLTYSINPDFVHYIVNKLLDKNIISIDEKIPYSISSELKDYDSLKQYYFALSANDKVNENLSENLAINVKNLKNIVSSIKDEDTKQYITVILSNLEELTDKINTKNVILLEQQLNLLFEKAITLKDTDKKVSFELIDVIISICKQTVIENKDINSRTLKIDKLYSLLTDEFDNNTDLTTFNNIISKLISIVQDSDNDNSSDSFNKQIVTILINTALYIYEPIAAKKLDDETSQEYKDRKKLCLDIFRRLALKRADDDSIYDYLFNISDQYTTRKQKGIGLTPETLEIFINAAKQNKYISSISVPNDEFISGNIEQLADMIVNSIEDINPISVFTYAFSDELGYSDEDRWFSTIRRETKDKAKKLSYYIIEKLLSTANDNNIDFTKRKRAVIVLLETISKGIDKNNIKDISIDLEQIKLLAEKFDIPTYLYIGSTYISHVNGYSEYTFTPLIKFIPQTILEQTPLTLSGYGRWQRTSEYDSDLLKTKKPIITKITGKTDTTKPEVQQVLFRFEVLQKILQYNTSVLSLLDKIKDPKNYDKNMSELLDELQAMINELKKINQEHGNAAQTALDNIKLSLKDSTVGIKAKVRRHLLLSDWTEESIKDIKEIHTLINAIHQTSILDFKEEIGDARSIGKNQIQIITARQESTISGYNLSNTINSNIVKFLSKLATRQVPNKKIDDFICKSDLVVWTTRLNAHSVDIFFNFGEADRGINIYYRERPVSYEDIGKKERIRYFKEILEYLGFYVETDTQYSDGNESYGLKATLNKDYGMNETMDLIDIATHVVEIFKYSTNVDYDLKSRHDEMQYEAVFDKWMRKAKRRELWYGVEINNYGWKAYGYGERGYKLDSLPEKRSLNSDSLNAILSYLGCDLLPEDTTAEALTDPIYLDKYFNKPIERAYIEGRIVFNKDNILVQNEGYDMVHSMINEINTNFTETSKQARIINLVNTYEFDTKILANIGNFVVVSSVMELRNGDKLFIKAIMDPNTKRMKYAIAERVATSTRERLTSDDLIKILGKEGYVIPQQEWVISRERERTRNLLSRKLQTIESPKIPSTPTSDGTGVSVVGNITFDKNKVDKNSILVVPYTTPNDIKFIETAKGIITTGGGILSHAAITTRELKKPSVVLNGATWTNDEIEILYYLTSGNAEIVDNQFHVQKVKTARMMLKEGSRVLINGETGTVLLFDDIDISLLDELQSYIDMDNSQAVIDFMNKYSQDENINRFVEYVYFQVVGNSKNVQILDCLFSDDMPETVQNKVKKLNDSYIQDKIQNISEAIENLKTINNVNIAYNILQELNKKLDFIKTVGTRPELENLKEQLKDIEQEIKSRLNTYMQKFINDLISLLSKDKLNKVDIQKAITMLKNIEIYDYFISKIETSKELLEKKNTIQILYPMIRDKINGYDEKKYDVKLQEEISLFEENADDEKLFGSKTSQLAKMFKLLKERKGVTVPGGIGISVNVMPMLFKFLGKENLLADFENAIKNKDKQKAMELAEEICNLIDSEDLRGTKLEKEILQQLNKFIKPGQKYSVRSSGVGEDATNNAFAGMGETKLNIKYDDIYDNVRECWKSFFAERCIDYMISSGQVVKPAVLVEEMIDSEKAGVVFSRDKYGNGRINALFGQGEGLVSGMFTPDSVLFDMNSGEIIEYSVADKQFKLITDVDGGIKKVAVGQQAKSRTLNAQNVKRLAEIISILENSVGYPIDVEFAIKDNEIYILQMRPITTLDNKENLTETFENQYKDIIDMPEIPFTETKYEISLTAESIPKGQEVFAYIANPLDSTQAIPVYKKSANGQITEFIVDSKYISLVKNGVLGKALLLRINSDTVMLSKLNAGIFNFKPGEIGLLPVLDEDMLEKSLSDSTLDLGIENIRSILASA